MVTTRAGVHSTHSTDSKRSPWLLTVVVSALAVHTGCKSSSLSSAKPDSGMGAGGTSASGGSLSTGGTVVDTTAVGGSAGGAVDGPRDSAVGTGGVSRPVTGQGGAPAADAELLGGHGGLDGLGGILGLGGITAIGGAGGAGGNMGGSGGDSWTDPNCYMRCGQGNAIYSGGGGVGGMSDGGGPASGGRSGGPAGWGLDAGTEECTNALPIKCNDQLAGSTLVEGRPDLWSFYPTTERVVSGPETVYVFQAPSHCGVKAQLVSPSKGLALFVLTGCGARWAIDSISSNQFIVEPGRTYYLVVDGYDGASGSYTLQVDCACE